MYMYVHNNQIVTVLQTWVKYIAKVFNTNTLKNKQIQIQILFTILYLKYNYKY